MRALAPAALRARVVAAFLPAVERRVPAAFAVVERLPAERVVVRLRAVVERRAGAFLAAGFAGVLGVVVPVVSSLGSVLPGSV